MTIRPHRDEPCWEIVYAGSGMTPECDSGDYWMHYLTREAAEKDLPERQADYDEPLRVAESFGGPCVGLFCDGADCDGEPIDFGGDEGWTHADPDDPTPMGLDELGVIERDGKHYCETCVSAWPWCDDCDDRHPEGECAVTEDAGPSPLCVGPDGTVLDVPLFAAGRVQ